MVELKCELRPRGLHCIEYTALNAIGLKWIGFG